MSAGNSQALLNQNLYEIKHSHELGRYLVARQDIEAGTLIICEEPLISGPADDETNAEIGQVPMCLGCYQRMTANPGRRCSKCTWPVCGFECESADHHAANECQVFVRSSVNYPFRHTWPVVNKSILVLRTLLLKNKYPSIWKEVILKLEHHTQIRQTKPHCAKADVMILDNLHEFLHTCGMEHVTDEEIIRVCGIINVNAFSSVKSDSYRTSMRIFQCIFPQSSLMAHCCIPNASWSIDGSGQLKISICAAVKIRKGEIISIAYNLPEMVYGTLHRLIAIEDCAHFVCKCIRCTDRTEAGTFVSAIKCFICEGDYLLPECPTNPDSIWKCCGCNSVQTVEKIVLFVNQAEDLYENIRQLFLTRQMEIKKLDLFIRQHEGMFHRNHYILQIVRMRIINLQLISLEDINETDLERVINHCKIMLSIADTLMPGLTKTRALLQFFLSQGLLLRAAAYKEDCLNGKDEAVKNMYKDIHYLQTRSLLYFSNPHSHAGSTSETNQFVTCIKRQLKSFDSYIDD